MRTDVVLDFFPGCVSLAERLLDFHLHGDVRRRTRVFVWNYVLALNIDVSKSQ